MFYSIIIPLYNRPDEIRELLESLTLQTFKNFEVIVVEDGSSVKAEDIVRSFSGRLDLHYYFKANSGPGPSRNFGFGKARGDFFIIFDSDCIIPPHYMQVVEEHQKADFFDMFGGPDKAHESFTPIQKAINYSMTSILTTGGIRGGKKRVGVFHPRSFNMGISRKVYEVTNGFAPMRYGEDIDFSIRTIKAGFKVGLIPEAYVFHKRRTSFKQFFRQIHHSGEARIHLFQLYNNELKITHFFPAAFVLFCVLTALLPIFSVKLFLVAFAMLLFYCLAIVVHATMFYTSIGLGFLSLQATFVQHFAYGTGFLKEVWNRLILRKKR